jgi:hypothetical protein
MGAVMVYRLDGGSNFSYHIRNPIGSVLELRNMNKGTTTRT